MPTKLKIIRPISYAGVKDSTLDQAGEAIDNGVYVFTDLFSTPPIDAATFRAKKTAFSASLVAAADGGKQAVAEKNKQRDLFVRAVRQIGHYVEVACKDDMAIFLKSGLTPVGTTRTKGDASIPSILWVVNGNSGQLEMRVKTDRYAASFVARYASVVNGTPAPWIMMPFTTARSVLIKDLTPAMTYTIQVCAVGKSGNTDWSDPVTRICT